MNIKPLTLGLLISAAMVLPGGAFGQAERPASNTSQSLAAPPDATLEFEASQLRLIVGGASGKGVLHFKGKDYPFTAKAASVGGVGMTDVHGTGTVHNLKNVEDFSGLYNAISVGAALGEGKGSSTFQNSKGVVISVKSKTEGVALNMGVGGVSITLAAN
jgi:hypothetical protein